MTSEPTPSDSAAESKASESTAGESTELRPGVSMQGRPVAPKHVFDLPRAEGQLTLEAWLEERGEPKFRIRQVVQQVWERRAFDPAAMSNLPGSLRTALSEEWFPQRLSEVSRGISFDGTRKYGFRLHDGALIEAVWIPSDDRGTLCVSSQAGCPAGCTFCATAAGGYRRNLTPAEILLQWLWVGQDVEKEGVGRVTQIVFMGMGEPLLNYDALSTTLRSLTDSDGFDMSPRRITVSTVGIAKHMPRLIEDFPQVRLALSLHSAREETRSKIVPMNRKYGLDELRKALSEIKDSGRRVTLEYVVLTDVNDNGEEAAALAEFGNETAGHINLLPFHPFPGASYPPTASGHMNRFRAQILKRGYRGEVTIRKSRGLDIQGACGQLALK